jgi:hypothetical protein
MARSAPGRRPHCVWCIIKRQDEFVILFVSYMPTPRGGTTLPPPAPFPFLKVYRGVANHGSGGPRPGPASTRPPPHPVPEPPHVLQQQLQAVHAMGEVFPVPAGDVAGRGDGALGGPGPAAGSRGRLPPRRRWHVDPRATAASRPFALSATPAWSVAATRPPPARSAWPTTASSGGQISS